MSVLPEHDPVPGRTAGEPAHEVRRTLGCLGRGGCGCLAFLIGATLVAGLVFPTLVGRWARGGIEEGFASQHAGRIVLPKLSLAWTERQVVEGAELFDEDGARVARLSIEVPSLVEGVRLAIALDDGRPARLGDVRVELDLDLVQDEDGVTNLERALAPRSGAGRRSDVRIDGRAERGPSSREDWPPIEARLVLVSRRLSWSTPRTRELGRDLMLEGVRGEVRLEPERRMRLDLSGDLAGTPPGRVRMEGLVEGLQLVDGGPEGDRLRFTARLEGVDARLVDALLEADGLLADTLGEHADVSFEVEGTAGEPARLETRLETPRVVLTARGAVEDDVLRCSGEEGLQLSSDLPPLLSEGVVGPLVPLLVDLAKPAAADPLRLAVRDLEWPLEGGLQGLRAHVTLELGTVTARLLPGLAEQLPGLSALSAREESLLPLEIDIADGMATYADVPLAIGGTRVTISGTMALASGEMSLTSAVPLELLGRDLRRLLDGVAGDVVMPITIGGTPASPRVKIDEGAVQKLLRDAGKQELEGRARDFLRKKLGGGR